MSLKQICFAIENGQPEEILNIAFLNRVKQAILDAEGDGGAVDSMHALLSKALMNYRCNRTVDEDGEPLPLVDVLSPGEGGTIQPGIEEIEFLAEYLADELPLPSTHPARSGVVSNEDVRDIWIEGYPNKIYASEWFIAQTKNRDRVVLRMLPEEYSYDYKTADETYIKKENVIRWMQFPDSQFIPFEPQTPVRSVSEADVDAALKIWNDAPALGRDEDDAYAMRATLEHFAKGERHER